MAERLQEVDRIREVHGVLRVALFREVEPLRAEGQGSEVVLAGYVGTHRFDRRCIKRERNIRDGKLGSIVGHATADLSLRDQRRCRGWSRTVGGRRDTGRSGEAGRRRRRRWFFGRHFRR